MGEEVVKKEASREELVKVPGKEGGSNGDGPTMMQRVQELAQAGEMGNLVLTDKEAEGLYAPIDFEAIQVRPDGLIYLPWTFYSKRLRDTFRMQWAMVAMGEPRTAGELVIWGFYLSVKGQIVGMPAMGECRYQSSNRTMSWGDAVEGAKSNALMRLCKNLGIGLELWDRDFVAKWRGENCEQKIVDGKMQWMKKAKGAEEKKEGGK